MITDDSEWSSLERMESEWSDWSSSRANGAVLINIKWVVVCFCPWSSLDSIF